MSPAAFLGEWAESYGLHLSLRAYEPTDPDDPKHAELNLHFDGGHILTFRLTPEALASLHKQSASALAALHGESPVDGPLLGSGARW